MKTQIHLVEPVTDAVGAVGPVAETVVVAAESLKFRINPSIA